MISSGLSTKCKNTFLKKVYFQMTLGLAITILTAFYVGTNYALFGTVMNFYYLVFLGEIVLVSLLSFWILKLSSFVAKVIFALFSVMNGLSLSYVIIYYNIYDIFVVLATVFVIFLVMSIYGVSTKENLLSYSSAFKTGLISIFVVSLINLFLGNHILDWFISIFAVVIFTGLIAFDTQRIIATFEMKRFTDEEVEKLSTIGALSLYLDLINLFLHLLRIFGRKNKD